MCLWTVSARGRAFASKSRFNERLPPRQPHPAVVRRTSLFEPDQHLCLGEGTRIGVETLMASGPVVFRLRANGSLPAKSAIEQGLVKGFGRFNMLDE